MRHPLRAGLFAAVVAAAALAVAPAAAHAGPTDPAPPALYVHVPTVVGETLGDAKLALVKSGLTVGAPIGVADCVNLGRVLAQDPAGGALVLRGSAVVLTVGTEPPKGCGVGR